MNKRHSVVGTVCRLGTAFTLALTVLVSSLSVQAQEAKARFSIAPQPASSALEVYAKQTGVQILFPYDDISSVKSKGVEGEFSNKEALQKLLEGTGLVVESVKNDVIVIRRAAEKSSDQATPRAASGTTVAKPDQLAGDIEEVIVTARRREEKLQDVPIAVTVLSGEQLAEKGITNMQDLGGQVPSLVVVSQGVSAKAFQVGVRGLRSTSFLVLDDPTVGTYFAEGVIAHPWGFGDTLFDIQSIQVLKGPQGTLFGRNTTGGAVLIEPNKASLDEGFGGNFKITLGDYSTQKIEGVVNVPLNDVAALRIAGLHDKRDGYTKNLLTGQKFDGKGNDAIRIGLLLRPTKDITSHTIFDYLTEDASPSSSRVIAVYGPNGGFGLGGPVASSYVNWSRILAEQKGRGPWEVASVQGTNGPFDQFSPLRCTPGNPQYSPSALCRSHTQPKETLTSRGILNNTQIDMDGFTLKNIISARRSFRVNDAVETFAGGSTVAPLPPSGGGANLQKNLVAQTQEEFQISGKALAENLDWITGAFYMREWGDEFGPTYTNTNVWVVSKGYGTNESKGLYAQGTYKLTDRLKATVGARKNWDYRSATDTSTATNGTTCQIRVGATAAFMPITNCVLSGEKKWQANTWTMSLDYKLDDGVLIYGTHSRGYKSGGFSLRSHRAAQFPYDPEFVTNTEAGIKADWTLFDQPIRTNFAFFNLDYTNAQIQVSSSGTTPITTYISNAGAARIWGGELEVTYKATKRLELSGFWSYNNPKYLTYQTAGAGGSVLSINARPFGTGPSLYNAGLSVAYQLPLDSSVGTATVRADASFHSKNIVDQSVAGLVGLPGAPATAGFTGNIQPGYSQLNLRADWRHPFGNPVDLGFYISNVTNVAYYTGQAAVNGLISAGVSPPRMYGIELNYRFGDGFKPIE